MSDAAPKPPTIEDYLRFGKYALLGWFGFAAGVLAFSLCWAVGGSEGRLAAAGQFGDSFGVFNALVSSLAVVGLVVNLQTQQFEIHKQNEDRERDKQDRKRSEREANENVERQLLIAYISALESLRQSAEQRMQPQSIGRKTHAQLHSIVVQARVMTALSQVTKMCERRIRQVSYENRDERIVSIGDIDVPGAWHWKLGKLWEIYDASIEEVEKLTGRSSDGKLVKSVCGAIHFHLRKLRAIEVHFTEKRRRAIADIFAKMPSKEAIGEILGEDAASAAARKTAAGYMAACVADLGDLIEDTSIDERHVEL